MSVNKLFSNGIIYVIISRMEKNPEFIGRKYEADEKLKLQQTMQSRSEESLLPIEGELEKTKEELLMIETIDSLIENELMELDVDTYKPIKPEQVHILSGSVFDDTFPDSTDKAFFVSASDIVYLNRDTADSRARIFSTLLHELIHRASTRKFYCDEADGAIGNARVGYRLRSTWKKDKNRQNRLRGFNELMADYTVYKLLMKNQQELESTLGITKGDIQGPIYTYMHYGPILESLLEKISKERDVSQGEVFADFERGQFSNNLLVLKQINSTFGKGSVEILSLLETLDDAQANNELEQMIKDYFSEPDQAKREALGIKITEFVTT